ncbi:hypothetical protein ACFE04_013140 [Oxalis oulophora]
MDYASPLLIFDQESSYIDYNLFQLSSPSTNNIQSLLNIDETLLFTPCEEEGIHTPENARRRKVSMTITDGNPNEKKKQKVIHRDIERQRRQEMATLYTSLRDLLPYEFLKGKRSISDHIQESANYIKHMENKMKILKNKKDYLKSLVLQSIGSSSSPKNTPKSNQQDILSIETCLDGVLEVSINTALTNGLPCSKVFDILIKEGLNILCSTSNKVDDKLIHIIKTKVSEGRSIAPADLHQRLSNLYS